MNDKEHTKSNKDSKLDIHNYVAKEMHTEKVDSTGGLENIKHIWVQGILSNQPIDIREEVKIVDGTLTLPGELIKRIAIPTESENEQSPLEITIKIER